MALTTSDSFPLPGIVARWITLVLSIAGMLVLIARWTAQIDSSIQMVDFRLRNAEAGQLEIHSLLSKIDGMQRLLDDRIAKYDELEREALARKKAMTSMQTSIEALTFRVHEMERAVRKGD